jgi:nitrate reductase NapAB chaperone NapD
MGMAIGSHADTAPRRLDCHAPAAHKNTSPPDELYIASCIARVQPACLPVLASTLDAVAGVHVYANDGVTKLVLILEGNSTAQLFDQMDALRRIAGVVSIDMVYQHAEEYSAMSETMRETTGETIK